MSVAMTVHPCSGEGAVNAGCRQLEELAARPEFAAEKRHSLPAPGENGNRSPARTFQSRFSAPMVTADWGRWQLLVVWEPEAQGRSLCLV